MKLHLIVTKAEGAKAASALQGMTMGFNQQIDKLGDIPGKQ